MIQYPKVLIINQQSIFNPNATGITMRSLWNDWPLENIMEIYFDTKAPSINCNKNFTSLHISAGILNRMAHSNLANRVNSDIKQQSVEMGITYKTMLRQAAVLALDTIPLSLSLKQKKIIEDFHPDIIYTLGASVRGMDLSYRISKRFDIPVVIHYMDNWPEILQWETNPLVKPYRRHLDIAHHKCRKRCYFGLAISPQMADAYQKKYKIPFISIMNSVDIDKSLLKQKKPGEPMRFVYAGGLHLDRWKALKDISTAIVSTGANAELHIFSNSNVTPLQSSEFHNNTFFHNSVDHSRIQQVYNGADVLIHAETDNPLLMGFFKYSISTKIPEYLASGREILFYGPKDLGLFKYLEANEAAYLASSFEELCEVIIQIIKGERKADIICNANRLAKKNHDVAYNRSQLKSVIIQSIAAHNQKR